MRCETTSSVKECALRARSTHGVHHAFVEVNIVICVVLGEVLLAHVVPLVVDAVIGLTLGLIAHVVIVVFVLAILHRIFCMGDILFTVTQRHVYSSSILPSWRSPSTTLHMFQRSHGAAVDSSAASPPQNLCCAVQGCFEPVVARANAGQRKSATTLFSSSGRPHLHGRTPHHCLRRNFHARSAAEQSLLPPATVEFLAACPTRMFHLSRRFHLPIDRIFFESGAARVRFPALDSLRWSFTRHNGFFEGPHPEPTRAKHPSTSRGRWFLLSAFWSAFGVVLLLGRFLVLTLVDVRPLDPH